MTLKEYITKFILETNFNKIPKTKPDRDNPDSYFYDSKLLLLFNNMLPDYKYYSTYSVARPDKGFIPHTGINIGLDPGGYCKTSVYFYVFILMLNIPIDPILSSEKPDIMLNPILSSDKISIIMIKWMHTTKLNTPDNLLMLRNFATIIFQYYYKFISLLFKQLTIITININNNNRDIPIINKFIELKYKDELCKSISSPIPIHDLLANLKTINYSINNESIVEVQFNNTSLINYKEENDCNNYLKQEIVKWYFINNLFINNTIYDNYKDIYLYDKLDEYDTIKLFNEKEIKVQIQIK